MSEEIARATTKAGVPGMSRAKPKTPVPYAAKTKAAWQPAMSTILAMAFKTRALTVKLRGRTEAPEGAEGAQSPSARGAKPQAHHGPLQRLLDCMVERNYCLSMLVCEQDQRATLYDARFRGVGS